MGVTFLRGAWLAAVFVVGSVAVAFEKPLPYWLGRTGSRGFVTLSEIGLPTASQVRTLVQTSSDPETLGSTYGEGFRGYVEALRAYRKGQLLSALKRSLQNAPAHCKDREISTLAVGVLLSNAGSDWSDEQKRPVMHQPYWSEGSDALLAQAREAIKSSVKNPNTDLLTCLLAASALAGASDLREARAIAELACKRFPDSEHVFGSAANLYEDWDGPVSEKPNFFSQEFQRAVAIREHIAHQWPGYDRNLFYLAVDYIRQQRFDKAKPLLETVLKRNRMSAFALETAQNALNSINER